MKTRNRIAALTAALAIFSGACSDESSKNDTGPGAGDASIANLKTCQRTCKTADECCAGPPCDAYPSSYECSADGFCKNRGCSGNDDCSAIPGASCVEIKGARSCVVSCQEDTECSGATPKCVDGKYCGKAAAAKKCASNANCSDPLDVCDVLSGACVCSGNSKCQAALGAAGGTWQCELFTP